MVWSSLSKREQEVIKERYLSGESVNSLARDFKLKPQSLARKMRKLGLSKKISSSTKFYKKEKYSVQLNNGDRYYNRRLNIFMEEPVSFLVFSDTHFGDEDWMALNAMLRILPSLNIDFIVHAGDALDLYGLSKYGKDHDGIFRRNLGQELESWSRFNYKLNNVIENKNVDKFILGGNHIRRYYTWLDQNLGLHGVSNMDLDNLMKLDEFGYAPMVNEVFFNPREIRDFPDPSVIIHHGTLARKFAGSSSRGESDRLGTVNSISGHVHRLAVNSRRTIRGIATTIEAGCLCSLDPEYMDYPDWTHGFVHCTFNPDIDFLSATPYMIFDGLLYKDGIKI